MKQYFILGSYTEPILFGTGEVFEGKGKGVSICSFEDGRIEPVSGLSVRNPSFLCVDEHHRKIYCVNEMKEYLGCPGGGMTQLCYDDHFSLSVQGSWNTGGGDPCHIALAPNGRFLAVANFAGGSLSVFPLDESGNVLGKERRLFQHTGSGAHPVRQKGPHAHSCVFSQNEPLLYVPDLGTDRVVCYRCQGEQIAPDPDRDVPVPAGSGPRYGEFSGDGRHFYLIDELSSQVMHFAHENGRLVPRETVDTLPADYTGDNICSDLHLTPDGRLLYASNRGHDSLVCYRVENDGSLRFLHRQSCGGRTPRNFAIDPTGGYLLVGNQDSDCIAIFQIEPDGRLHPMGRMETGSPVCIRFFQSAYVSQE